MRNIFSNRPNRGNSSWLIAAAWVPHNCDANWDACKWHCSGYRYRNYVKNCNASIWSPNKRWQSFGTTGSEHAQHGNGSSTVLSSTRANARVAFASPFTRTTGWRPPNRHRLPWRQCPQHRLRRAYPSHSCRISGNDSIHWTMRSQSCLV